MTHTPLLSTPSIVRGVNQWSSPSDQQLSGYTGHWSGGRDSSSIWPHWTKVVPPRRAAACGHTGPKWCPSGGQRHVARVSRHSSRSLLVTLGNMQIASSQQSVPSPLQLTTTSLLSPALLDNQNLIKSHLFAQSLHPPPPHHIHMLCARVWLSWTDVIINFYIILFENYNIDLL